MRERILFFFIILLLFACAGEGHYIYAQKNSTGPAKTEDWQSKTEKLYRDIQDSINKKEALSDKLFDDFFNDDFFGRRFIPFEEMEDVHRHITDMFGKEEKNVFDSSWDKWFSDRMGMEDFKTEIKRKDKKITVAIKIPGIDKKTAEVNINDSRIKISFTAKTVKEEKKAGSVTRSESLRSYVKILPVPQDAVPGTGKAQIEKDAVKIVFERENTKR